MYYICTNNKKLALHTDFMSKLFTLMMLLFIGGSSFAQRHELGIRVGGTALVGDIGKTNYLPTSVSIHKISEYGIHWGSISYECESLPDYTIQLRVCQPHL